MHADTVHAGTLPLPPKLPTTTLPQTLPYLPQPSLPPCSYAELAEGTKLHGYVGVKLNGTIICEEASVQHNRSYSKRSEILATMAEAVIEAAQKQQAAGGNGDGDTPEDAIADAVQGLALAAAAAAAADGANAAEAPVEEGATCLLERPKPTASL